MWTSVVYIQARSERPIWPLILVAVFTLVLVNIQTYGGRTKKDPVIAGPQLLVTQQLVSNQNVNFNVILDNPDLKDSLDTAQNVANNELSLIEPPLNMSDFVPGKPLIRGLIVTTWRSGSTLAGQLLSYHPGTYYFCEPLNWARIHRFANYMNPEEAKVAVELLRSSFKCDYDSVKEMWPEFPTSMGFVDNIPIRQFCANGMWKTKELCSDPDFHTFLCSIYPIQIMKTVRLELNLTLSLLTDPELDNLKVVYLVRDPRAVINSRSLREWCVEEESCIQPKPLCHDMVHDYYSALELLKRFPHRVKIVRYEALASEIWSQSQDLVEFFGLGFHPKMAQFLTEATSKQNRQQAQVWNTFRDPHIALSHWKNDLTFEQVQHVQKDCHEALRLWGYNEVESEKNWNTLQLISPLNLPTVKSHH